MGIDDVATDRGAINVRDSNGTIAAPILSIITVDRSLVIHGSADVRLLKMTVLGIHGHI
jgi:hypothetical protein